MPAERLEVVAALDGERVDRVVAMATGLSRAAATRLVADGRVRLAGSVVTARAARVGAGQVLDVDWDVPDPPPPAAADPAVAVDVVHADEDLIVVDKAAGVVVHPGNGVRRSTLVAGLVHRFPEVTGVGEAHRPGIVHRLDRGTSGLLAVARSPLAYEALVAALAERRVVRRYRCLVHGHPGAAAGLVDAPIGRSRRDPTRRAVVEGGRAARTRYQVEETFGDPEDVALLTCELETGRTHQIRVHLQAIGHAVVADDAYGGSGARLGLGRPFLHAAELALDHPRTGEPLSFSSALPADLSDVLVRLRAAGRRARPARRGTAPSPADDGLGPGAGTP